MKTTYNQTQLHIFNEIVKVCEKNGSVERNWTEDGLEYILCGKDEISVFMDYDGNVIVQTWNSDKKRYDAINPSIKNIQNLVIDEDWEY